MSGARSAAALALSLLAAGCGPPPQPPPRCPEGMIALAATTYRRGSDPSDALRAAGEWPAHEVKLRGFCLDAREVTEADLARTQGRPAEGCAECPATAVTWEEADGYCRARGARLPTEAEFERAVRDATRSIYPWGASWPPPAPAVNARDASLAALEPLWVPEGERAYDDGHAGPAPACALGRDARGFCDLLGNAAEWCSDRFASGAYSFARSRDPRGPARGTARVVRGGSFAHGPRDLRSAARAALDGGSRSALVGFRCAADGSGP